MKRRVLAKRYRPDPAGPSWLTLLGHARDSLWSVDFFRCESLTLRSHWVFLVRREFLDQVPFWTSTDLERKLSDFARYYNRERAHRALGGMPPVPSAKGIADIHSVTWQSHCRGLYRLPVAA